MIDRDENVLQEGPELMYIILPDRIPISDSHTLAEVAELADALDSGSSQGLPWWRFESSLRHFRFSSYYRPSSPLPFQETVNCIGAWWLAKQQTSR